MTHRSLTFALLGAVALAFCVAPALAKPGEDGSDGGNAADRRAELREKYDEKCTPPANERAAAMCEQARHVAQLGFKARRAAHALLEAINATEMRIAHLEVREARLQAAVDSGELSAENQTKAEHRLEVVQHQLEKARERLVHLNERLDHLKEKWAEVRDHVADVRDHMQERRASASPSPSPSA